MKRAKTKRGEEGYENNPLWGLLVEVVHSLVMYPRHKAYIRDVLIHDKPGINPKEASRLLAIPLGEALVIFSELKKEGYL
jgi:hypothetical protein